MSGPELGVPVHAQDDLLAARGHLLDEDAGDPAVRHRRLDIPHHLVVGVDHRLVICQPDPHAAHIGLVDDLRRHDLHDHRIADLPRGGHCLVHAVDDAVLQRRDAIGLQHRQRLEAEHADARPAGVVDDLPDCGTVRLELPGRLVDPVPDAVVPGQHAHRIGRALRVIVVQEPVLLEQVSRPSPSRCRP